MEGRKKRREEEAAAEPGTIAKAGQMTVPESVSDNVIWTAEDGRKYVRVSGVRTVMVFEVIVNT